LWHLQEPKRTPKLAEVRKTAETKVIREILQRTGGDREKAAQLLDISPRTLRHKIQTYRIPV
jgi:DNA-binding NtrC family response regulator